MAGLFIALPLRRVGSNKEAYRLRLHVQISQAQLLAIGRFHALVLMVTPVRQFRRLGHPVMTAQIRGQIGMQRHPAQPAAQSPAATCGLISPSSPICCKGKTWWPRMWWSWRSGWIPVAAAACWPPRWCSASRRNKENPCNNWLLKADVI